jgi:hypothetical protein
LSSPAYFYDEGKKADCLFLPKVLLNGIITAFWTGTAHRRYTNLFLSAVRASGFIGSAARAAYIYISIRERSTR